VDGALRGGRAHRARLQVPRRQALAQRGAAVPAYAGLKTIDFMFPRAHAPIFAYLFAVVAGLFNLAFAQLLTLFVDMPRGSYVGARMLLLSSFALGQFVPEAACAVGVRAPRPPRGPKAGWRWGVWLCAVPACIISFNERGAFFFIGWALLTMLPACAGGYFAAALYPKL